MKNREAEFKDFQERFSRRFQNGVEILERETVRTIKVDANESEAATARKIPRLVIAEAIARPGLIITKSRAQLRDIDAFLRNVIRRPLGQNNLR